MQVAVKRLLFRCIQRLKFRWRLGGRSPFAAVMERYPFYEDFAACRAASRSEQDA